MKYTYDALVVLGAVMEWDPHRQIWDFPAIIERYAGKLVMGKVRALAAMLLQDLVPVILVTGGSDKHPETGEICSRSIELAELITEVYGIRREKVIPIGAIGASHTLGNVENIIQYLEDNPYVFRTGVVGILSPAFQRRRAAMMFRENPYFRTHGIRLEWITAEDVIESRCPELCEYFDWIYSTEAAFICSRMEIKGIIDLRGGQYQPKT